MNHFHNPLLPWGQSYMTDVPWVFQVCSATGWSHQYSNVTWATGYLSLPPTGTPTDETFPDSWENVLESPAPNNWNNARAYYYRAVTSSLDVVRQTNFAKTFLAVGQVMHLLEDMAVPAHVRNDFKSHLAFTGINQSNFLNASEWVHNLFEYYVMNHHEAVDHITDANIQAVMPSSSGVQLTDFWGHRTI